MVDHWIGFVCSVGLSHLQTYSRPRPIANHPFVGHVMFGEHQSKHAKPTVWGEK